jgi:class 3 adenylate cyclase
MYRLFKRSLKRAGGRSEYVFSLFADIRGFTEFSKAHEAPDIAMYIKRVYLNLIDDYFPFASFYKPTGDGLLLTFQIRAKRKVTQEPSQSSN